MKINQSREWRLARARNEANVVISAGPAMPPIYIGDGDPHYGDDVAPAVEKIVDLPPVKRGMGLVRD